MSVRCGNKVHGNTRTNHSDASEVRACYAESAAEKAAETETVGYRIVENRNHLRAAYYAEKAAKAHNCNNADDVTDFICPNPSHAAATGRFENRLTEIAEFGASAVAEATVTAIDLDGECNCSNPHCQV